MNTDQPLWHSLMAVTPSAWQCTPIQDKTCSEMTQGTWQRTQGVDLTLQITKIPIPSSIRGKCRNIHNTQDLKDLRTTPWCKIAQRCCVDASTGSSQVQSKVGSLWILNIPRIRMGSWEFGNQVDFLSCLSCSSGHCWAVFGEWQGAQSCWQGAPPSELVVSVKWYSYKCQHQRFPSRK